jgi:hypothetical protein
MRRQERIENWAAKLSVAPVVWFETIKQYKDKHEGKAPPAKSLNKIGTLAAFRIDPSGSRLPIDYSWYRYGTVAERLPGEILRFEEPESGRPCVDWKGPRPGLGSDDSLAERVKEEIGRVLSDYPSEESFERMVDEVYEFAPFPFQRSFRLARMRIGLTGRGSRFEEVVRGREFWDLFTQAISDFPEQEFPQVALMVGPLRELVKLTWNQLPSRETEVTKELVEGFWETFCAFLRVHDLGHSKGLSRERIHSRAVEAGWSLDRLKDLFGDAAIDLAQSTPGAVEDATLGPIIEKRKKDLAEQTAALDQGLAAADDIRKIIAQGD